MRSVQIDLFGQSFTVKTDAEEHYVKEIARFLESKVRKFSNNEEVPEIPHPFLLTAFKIVDDLFRAEKELEEYKNRAEQRSKGLVEMLDRSLARVDNLQGEFGEDGASRA